MAGLSDNEENEFTTSKLELNSNLKQDLNKMKLKQLNEYEDKIKEEFKKLSKTYLKNRISRIDNIIESLVSSIKIAQENDKSWLKIYNFEIETINNILTNTEDLIMVKNGTIPQKPDLLKLDEYEEELKEIFSNLQSPFDFDDTFKYDNKEISTNLNNHHENLNKLPFPFLFNDCFKPYRDELKSINSSKDYESKLIKNNFKHNSEIIWKQYYSNLLNYKTKLVKETDHRLTELYKDYQLFSQNKNEISLDNYYYRSLISPEYLYSTIDNEKNSLTSSTTEEITNFNHDTNYFDLDTRLNPKNKIQLSMIRQNILKNSKLENIQKSIKRTYHDAFEDEEINQPVDDLDKDLNLIRSNIALKKSRHIEEIVTEEEDEDDNDMEGELMHLNDFTSESSSSSPPPSGEELDDHSDNEELEEDEDATKKEIYIPRIIRSLCESVYEEYDVEEDMNEEELKERSLYKNVLQQTNSLIDENNKFIMQNLPPLESFPTL
ncbi:hypothetical protein KGF54_005033 [Candida jiufengensis]|uniref:uncharacterized protein n=1 Tax=Candida jiufengensis TaxID=497108 RepID=UPI0022250FDD|nr:uncharacterized protein KGF54_005033 [Candida jiufengensis]KAI5951958.1 hypothetical protein KGF54_005033 [Candida jiufengensis]